MGDPLDGFLFGWQPLTQNIFQQSHKPGKLQTDVGSEFKNKIFKPSLNERMCIISKKREINFMLYFFSASVIIRLGSLCFLSNRCDRYLLHGEFYVAIFPVSVIRNKLVVS